MIYNEVGDLTRANKELPPSHFFTFVSETYAQTQAVGVRRQVETSTRVISLATLLTEMAGDAERLSRKFYVSMYDEHLRDLADPDFDRLTGNADADHIPASVIQGHLDAIRAATQPIADYVNRHLAHRDRDPLDTLPTFIELNSAIDTIGEAFNECSLMLNASSWATLEAVMQYDWLAVFRVPWIPPDEHRGTPGPRLLGQ